MMATLATVFSFGGGRSINSFAYFDEPLFGLYLGSPVHPSGQPCADLTRSENDEPVCCACKLSFFGFLRGVWLRRFPF
jgi:hypothetical protein